MKFTNRMFNRQIELQSPEGDERNIFVIKWKKWLAALEDNIYFLLFANP